MSDPATRLDDWDPLKKAFLRLSVDISGQAPAGPYRVQGLEGRS